MAAASPVIVFACMSGPMGSTLVLVWLFISAVTSLTAFYLGAVWAELMWLFLKDDILRAAEIRAKRERS
jgi:hypothetical protein